MEINQNSVVNKPTLITGLRKIRNKVEFSLAMIENDISKLERISKGKHGNMLKNLKKITEHIKSIKRCVKNNNGVVEITWGYNDLRLNGSRYPKVISLPFDTTSLDVVGIYPTDYFVINNKRGIRIDFSELMDGLALEIAHNDLGISIEDIENQLSSIGILSISDIGLLKDKGLIEDSIRDDVLCMKIADSEYYCKKENTRYSYLGRELPNGDTYFDVLTASMYEIMALILTEYLDKVDLSGLVEVSEKSMLLLVDKEEVEKIVKQIEKTNIRVRLLGRKFDTIPDIEII